MTYKRALQLLEIERECVSRGYTCDRDCANCELVQDTGELLEMYSWVMKKLHERTSVMYGGECDDRRIK